MSAEGKDIIIEKGSTFVLVHTAPKALSGASARMKMRAQHGTAQVASFVSPTHITLTVSGNTTTITVTISATTTTAFTAPQSGVYDLETELAGVVERHLEGAYYITPEVTY